MRDRCRWDKSGWAGCQGRTYRKYKLEGGRQSVILPCIRATLEGNNGNPLSYLPGQRLSRCTCDGEDHPGPKLSDGTYRGRAAPEIDVIEAQASL
jgi:hypothetical protein